MNRGLQNVGDHRVATALAHPLRVAVLSLLERGPASPTEMARELKTPVENLSYHVRKLRDLGFIEIYELGMARGAVKHTYRLVARPHVDEAAWAAMPAVAREAMWSASVAESMRMIAAGLRQGGMDRGDSIAARVSLKLDEQGFAAASKVLQDTIQRLLDIEEQAGRRLADHVSEACDGTLLVHFFETPDMALDVEDGERPDGRRRHAKHKAASNPHQG